MSTVICMWPFNLLNNNEISPKKQSKNSLEFWQFQQPGLFATSLILSSFLAAVCSDRTFKQRPSTIGPDGAVKNLGQMVLSTLKQNISSLIIPRKHRCITRVYI